MYLKISNYTSLIGSNMFYDDLFFDVLDVFYKHLKPLSENYISLFKIRPGLILTPDNFSFIDNEEKKNRVEEYIKKFDDFNWEIGFSISTDGPVNVATREGRQLEEQHFERLFQWVLDHPANGFHSIISAANVANSIESYKWWKESYAKYLNNAEFSHLLPYWLEARNDDWDRKSITEMLKLLDYMIKDRLKDCGDDLDEFTKHIFHSPDAKLAPLEYSDLINITLDEDLHKYESAQCSLSHLTCITLNNLNLVPCHRLNYLQFRGGQFIVKDNKITGIEALNPVVYIVAKNKPEMKAPYCSHCDFKVLCKKGCCGAQYESSGELFLPIESVCILEQNMICFLVETYNNMGVLDRAKEFGLLTPTEIDAYNLILAGIKEGHYAYERL